MTVQVTSCNKTFSKTDTS